MDVEETERLAAIRRYEILDTPPDGTFDRITRMAARLLGVPIAIVSIVDEDRIWFKARHGIDVEQIPRDPGLCASAILGDEPLVLPDAQVDPVALANPLVAGEFGLRFYAAAPLVTPEGFRLGTLCVIDREPRELTSSEIATLEDLAALVVHELELRLSARMTVRSESELRREAERDQRRAEELTGALQRVLLPPQLPEIPGVELAAHYRPANHAEVGGDFYDVFPLGRRTWGLTVGDVCGKGAAAGAVSGTARYALRAAAVDHEGPGEVLSVVNETLLIYADRRAATDPQFCTLVFARLQTYRDGVRVSLARGGHPTPLLVRRDGNVESIRGAGGVVGAFPGLTSEDRRVYLRQGDAMVFFTDGLTEATVGSGLLGPEGVIAALAEGTGLTAQEMVNRLVLAIDKEGSPIRDDVAIVALRVNRSR